MLSDVRHLLTPNPNPTPAVLVIDDFYENPLEVREWVLNQDFRKSHL